MTVPSRVVSREGLADYARQQISDAMAYPETRLNTHRFHLPALDIDLWHADQSMVDLCRHRLVTHNESVSSADHARVFMMDATLESWKRPALWDTDTGFSSREFEQVLAGCNLRGFYHHAAPSWQFYDVLNKTGVHSLPSPGAIPPWETGSPLRLFLHWAYAAAGKRLTHAATLGVEGQGVLVVGPSGSGKSGTTLAGLLNGLTSAGDDYVLVEPTADNITAKALFRMFKQDQGGLTRVGLKPEDIGAGELNWHGKYEFDAQVLAPKGFVHSLNLKGIIIPHIARLPRTQIERVSVQQAALALTPSAVFQLPGDTNDGIRFFSDLARRLPAYRVRLSQEPSEIADAISALIWSEAFHAY